MKTRLSLFCITLALLAANVAEAQLVGHSFGDQYCEPAFQTVSGDLYGGAAGGYGVGNTARAGWPGRVWFQSNVADQGLGYEGTYLTLGTKSRLFEDRLDGRWVWEGEIHHSIEEDGGLFANVGVERVFSIHAAEADVSVGAWYDYDGDQQSETFGHDFHQVGATAQIKTRRWDLIGNGYFPVGIQEYTYGDITGANCFVGNDIVMIPGIDAALEGFDVTLRMRPEQLSFANGSIDVGGYHYSSDLIDAFAGGRLRMSFQVLRGAILSAEVNHDDRFNTTGLLSVGWVFGANASGYGHEYSGIGRDLEQTVRNDHIVRAGQEAVIAMDPTTSRAYNVLHVDNEADPMFADGTAERPFSSLVTAQTLSAPGDVILVNEGDGTDRNMDRGIILQNNQRLWGTGSSILIPVQNGQFFQLCDTSGTPTISNEGGFAAVTMANNNDVAGINVDATNATFGIWGNGNNGSIRSNTVANANEDGVRLANISGDWSISQNTLQNNGRSGMLLQNMLDTTGNLLIEENVATGNISDGIQVRNYDPASTMVMFNTTSNNFRNGLFMENYLNSTGAGVLIKGHTSDANSANGIFMNIGSGNLDILDSVVTNNGQAGILIRNWSNTMGGSDRVLVGTMPGGTSTISGNGALANISLLLDDDGAFSRVMITDQTINGGVRGIAARVQGNIGSALQTRMDIDILDNLAIDNHINDGIRLSSFDSGLINARIGSTIPGTLQSIVGNASGGGNGIALFAEGQNGQPEARINAFIDNVNISNAQNIVFRPGVGNILIPTNGIQISSLNNALVNADVTNSTIGDSNPVDGFDTQNGIFIFADNSGSRLINTFTFDNLTMFNDIGVALITETETFSDLIVSNSTFLPNGIQSVGGRSDDTPFGDGIGSTGIFINTNGQGALTGQFNDAFRPLSEIGFLETVSDGVFDNLTRVNIFGNTIQDFTFEGVDINTNGDAQMLLTMNGNNIFNNGAGFDDDVNNNNVFNDILLTGQPNQLLFYDGVNINAFDASTISTIITGNVFRDNFERGLSLNTFNTATINAVVNNNVFFGNDRGEDINNTIPPIGVGAASGPTGPLLDSAIFDFEAINNEEFYIRDYETLVFTNNNGTPVNLDGSALPADSFGIFYPFNTGSDIFGNPVARGTARLNLSMSSNSFQLGVDLQDFSVAPGDFELGLDGATNGFTGPFFGITDVSPASAISQVAAEDDFFENPPNNFPPN